MVEHAEVRRETLTGKAVIGVPNILRVGPHEVVKAGVPVDAVVKHIIRLPVRLLPYQALGAHGKLPKIPRAPRGFAVNSHAHRSCLRGATIQNAFQSSRSEEHTSELQSL